jgi:hypothetical protein
MDDIALRLGIGDLCAAYADCIDDDRLEEWPDFFTDDCRYLVTDRDSHQAGLRHGVIYCASRGKGAIVCRKAQRWVLVGQWECSQFLACQNVPELERLVGAARRQAIAIG